MFEVLIRTCKEDPWAGLDLLTQAMPRAKIRGGMRSNASRPLANGPSVPSTEIMAHNIELMGHTHALDTSCFKPVADHFEKVGKAAGYLVNQNNEYDVLAIRHQVPGGMTGKRYETVRDEVIQYAAGHYGQTVAPIAANVLDQIMAAPRAKTIVANPPEQPTLAELHRRYGTNGDDDEPILRALVPQADIEKMRAAGPIKTNYPLLSSPELEQVARLMKIAKSPLLQLRTADLDLSLSR
ncbi:MAG: hypothetical protein ACT4PG_05075 [Panacagrimonas sp.]